MVQAIVEIINRSLNFIYQEDNLKKNVKTQHIFKTFPYHRLQEVSSLDYKTLNVSFYLIASLIEWGEFSSNINDCVVHTLDFILHNLEFLMKHDDAGLPLKLLLDALYKLMKVLNKNIKAYNLDRILNVIYLVAKCKKPDIDVVAVCTLTQIIPYLDQEHQISLASSHLANNFESFKEKNDVYVMTCIAGMVLQINHKNISELEKIYFWIEDDLPYHVKRSNNGVEKMLDVFLIVYEIKSCISLVNMSNHLLKNLPCIVELYGTSTFREKSARILAYILATMWEVVHLPLSCDFKMIYYEIMQMPHEISRWPITTFDMFYIIAYVESMYSNLQWTRVEVLNSIMNKLDYRTKLSLVATKCLFYLASTNIRTNDYYYEFKISRILSQKLKAIPNINNVLSYKKEQLGWILKYGCKFMQLEVLRQWFNSDVSDDTIVDTLKSCQVNNLFIDLILRHPNDRTAERTVKIMKQMSNPYLEEEITDAILLVDDSISLKHLFASSVSISFNLKKNFQLCRRLPVFLKTVDDECFKAACEYSIRLLLNLKNEERTPSLFLHELRAIFRLLKAARRSAISAVPALRLLQILVFLQVKHKLRVAEIPVNIPRILMDQSSENKSIQTIDLLHSILKYRTRNSFLYLNKDLNYFDAYQILMTLNVSGSINKILKCLEYLLHLEKSLAYSESNSNYIEYICVNSEVYTKPQHFLLFLKVWLTILGREKFATIPIKTIKEFIRCQSKSELIKDITSLLKQCGKTECSNNYILW